MIRGDALQTYDAEYVTHAWHIWPQSQHSKGMQLAFTYMACNTHTHTVRLIISVNIAFSIIGFGGN